MEVSKDMVKSSMDMTNVPRACINIYGHEHGTSLTGHDTCIIGYGKNIPGHGKCPPGHGDERITTHGKCIHGYVKCH
jgi:hypothetical protein